MINSAYIGAFQTIQNTEVITQGNDILNGVFTQSQPIIKHVCVS